MRAQCYLLEIEKPDARMKQLLAADPRLVFHTHVNKGKRYPYSSKRQNTRAALRSGGRP